MRRLISRYSMVLILLGLCAILSAATVAEQVSTGATGGAAVATDALQQFSPGVRVVIVAGEGHEDGLFAQEAARVLQAGQATVITRVQGTPRSARLALEKLAQDGAKVDVVLATARAGRWAVLEDVGRKYPGLGPARVLSPKPYLWPNFLKAENLRNIANQIAIIAILAIGMTLVVVTGGIDLSVGSMIALSSVIAAMLIRDYAGARDASWAAMLWCAAAAIAACAALGMGNGLAVTLLRVPPFIVTLGTMLAASGLAGLLCNEQTISELPASATWLGRRSDLLGLATWLGRGANLPAIPNAVVLMLVLYGVAHIVMTRTTLGRHIYAVGGNAEAARLSGVPVTRVLLLVYAICGALAGLGGIVMTSLFQGAMPTYGDKYEMFVVAAVVVGGTSIAGGEGKVMGTLIGAFIIAVIQNGMNLMGVQSRMQLVVLGAVIVGAVALDRVKRAK